MNQSVLRFDFSPSYREEDFLISPANEEALRWIKGWPDAWPSQALNLYGAKGCGKTHLAHIWGEATGAGWFAEPGSEAMGAQDAWIVDEPHFTGAESAWFHTLNRAREERKWLLFVTQAPLAAMQTSLPDLNSRLLAVPAVALRQPDDALLAAVMAKRFSDRQLKVPPAVLSYLVARMERSFASATVIVERLDAYSLKEKRNITMNLAKKILESQ